MRMPVELANVHQHYPQLLVPSMASELSRMASVMDVCGMSQVKGSGQRARAAEVTP